MKIKITDLILLLSLIFGFSHATAQVDLNATDAADDPGQPVDIFIDVTGDGSANAASWRLLYPTSEISNVDASQCGTSNPDTSGDTGVSCGATCGAFSPPSGFDCVSFILSPDDNFSPQPIASTQLGPITFTIDSNASPATSFDLTFADTDVVGSTDPGTITVQAPAGGFYSSSPAPGEQLNLGAAVVNSAATPVDMLTVSNASVDDFSISGFNSADTELALPAGTFVVPGEGSLMFDGADAVTCTPSTVGDNMGSFDVTHDADGGATSAVGYDYICVGQAPNVQVAPTTVDLNGSIGGPPPTAQFTVSNPDNGTASDAQNVQLSEAGDAEISITDGLTDNVIAVDESDAVEVSCETGTDDTFSKTITVSWDDPETGGTANQEVTVNCEIANVAPGFTSDPGVPGPLAFGQIVNGETSAVQTIAIGNEDSVGMGAGAQLEITGATLSDSVNYSFSPDPFTATLEDEASNGTASIDVFCNPQSIGDFSGETLTIQTNDGDQAFDLTCEGTSNAGLVVTPNVIDGTFNLGSVPPGSTASNSITFSNSGSDPLNLTCTLTDNQGGVITSTALPSDTAIPPEFTITFDGTPPDISSFQETLDCTVDDPSTSAAPDQTFAVDVAVSGRPLVIPTMSHWGLIVMSLMLLLVGGLAGRRMMA